MAQEYSFDVACGFDKQEFTNALDQARREIASRYDFKGVLATIEMTETELVLHTESEYKLQALIDLIESKMVRREVPLSVLDKEGAVEQASGGTVRQRIKLIESLTTDQAKELAKSLRTHDSKLKPVIQGDSVRVVSKSKDELQGAITFLKQTFPKLPLKFTNYR